MALKDVLKKYKPLDTGLSKERMDVFQQGLDAISVKHLTKAFGDMKALDDLSISFPKSLVTGLIGPSGAGKSTLINLITGALKPDDGLIALNGQAYSFIEPYRMREFKVARTFQNGRVIGRLSVEDNLLLAVAKNNVWQGLKEFETEPYKKKLEGILIKTGLKEYRRKKAAELSVELKKMLDIGRALMQDADIYIFDEPFTGISSKMLEDVLSAVDILRVEAKTVILIEHNMSLIEKLSDYLIVLDHGKVLADGAPKDVLKNKRVRDALKM